MKKLMLILLVGCVLVISQGFRKVAADDEGTHGTPLRKLAGTYALTVHGSFFFCLDNDPPHGPVTCTEGSTGVSIDALAVGAYTSDTTGNACATWTETETALPVSAAPPTIFVIHQTAKITNYDSTTGTGDGTFTNYFGGTCHGSTFDSTGATVAATGTYHFAVSNGGKRSDSVVTSLTNSVGAFGGFSISGTALRE
jgi:hypothetical protein